MLDIHISLDLHTYSKRRGLVAYISVTFYNWKRVYEKFYNLKPRQFERFARLAADLSSREEYLRC